MGDMAEWATGGYMDPPDTWQEGKQQTRQEYFKNKALSVFVGSENMKTLKYKLADGLPDDWFQAPANADAGYDLRFYNDSEYPKIANDHPKEFRTGVYLSIPKGYVGIIKDRSSRANKGYKIYGGVIDSGYTGEIIVLVSNSARRGIDKVLSVHGDKIAQLVIVPILTLPVERVESLEQTERGDNGFGSTGR